MDESFPTKIAMSNANFRETANARIAELEAEVKRLREQNDKLVDALTRQAQLSLTVNPNVQTWPSLPWDTKVWF